MINIAKLEKGRIHSQIGSIPDLFRNLKEISTTFWSGTHTLINIPLRSMLINAVVPLKDTRNRIEAERRLTYTSTGSHKSAPVDFDLLVSYHLTKAYGFNKIQCSSQDDVARRH